MNDIRWNILHTKIIEDYFKFHEKNMPELKLDLGIYQTVVSLYSSLDFTIILIISWKKGDEYFDFKYITNRETSNFGKCSLQEFSDLLMKNDIKNIYLMYQHFKAD